VVVTARALGGSVLDQRAGRHSVVDGDGAQAARSRLGTVPERVCLPYRSSNGAQTRERSLVCFRHSGRSKPIVFAFFLILNVRVLTFFCVYPTKPFIIIIINIYNVA